MAERLAEAGLDPVLLESAPGRANVVARIGGSDPEAGALLLHGHLDVVPAEPGEWERDPFSGEIDDGVLHGRGAVDMKNADAVLLAVARQMAASGTRPRRDIVLAFTADEEDTAAYGAQWLVTRASRPVRGMHRGGRRVRRVHLPRRERSAAVPARLRGARDRLAETHRARPGGPRLQAEPSQCRGKARGRGHGIAAYRWPVRLIPTVQAAICGIAVAVGAAAAQPEPGEEEGWAAELLPRLGPAAALVAATVRNSANPTMLDAGDKVNVIPAEATACVDGRVLAGYEDEFAAALDELTGPDVSWEYLHREIPLEAPLAGPLVIAMTGALLAEDPGGKVVPYCMGGGTDAKQFARLGIAGYGFTRCGCRRASTTTPGSTGWTSRSRCPRCISRYG